jgi:hypothetical protein
MGRCVEVVESQLTRGEEVATDESAATSRSGKAWGISSQGTGRANLSLSESRNLTSNTVCFIQFTYVQLIDDCLPNIFLFYDSLRVQL